MSLKRTHLFEYHQKFGTLVEFAGFEMPVWYEAVAPEHLIVRNSVGIFDVTHMGRSIVSGREAPQFLDYVMTRDSSRLAVTQGQYNLLCNECGGVIDDLTVFRLRAEEYLIIYNAANREKDNKWLKGQTQGFNVGVRDISDETAMFAVQGPKAQQVLQKLTTTELSTLKRYWLTFVSYDELKVSLSRSGYTGEDGFEVHLWNTPLSRPEAAVKLWNDILAAGSELIRPCGLGARDTLRLEAGMCLYGNDIDENTTPFEARLDFAVKLDKPRFIGREALAKQKQEGVKRTRVGLRMVGRAIPRKGFAVYGENRKLGEITSGTYSPLLQQGIAMAYLPPAHAAEGIHVKVDIRGRSVEAEACPMPFYDSTRFGWRRKQG